eukprot:gnl/Hemi2/21218_TR7036_c0_g1_i1.p1 gnl/Hemi2/21218_TR7036_c0_g1~~gnl/Hemi2/21218_TR7036_c0_g1_i1.p1  ORF type:complete len:116 (+),score=41.52 gnl/Hemi2/21218_TR7036_c0_g1_i1:53-349(+)
MSEVEGDVFSQLSPAQSKRLQDYLDRMRGRETMDVYFRLMEQCSALCVPDFGARNKLSKREELCVARCAGKFLRLQEIYVHRMLADANEDVFKKSHAS